MKRHFWLEIISWCSAIAFGLSLLLVLIGAAAGAAGGQSSSDTAPPSATESKSSPEKLPLQNATQEKTEQEKAGEKDYEGMVTDTTCGAKHRASIAESASDCVRICVHSGSAFALIVGEKTYILDGDLILLKKSAGMRARIHGNLTGNKLKVASVTAA